VTEPTVARSYAEALFALGAQTGEHEVYARALGSLAALLESDTRIRDFLASPKIEVAAKKQALASALQGHAPRLFLNFVLVVLDKRRHRLFPAIAQQHRLLLDEHLGRVHMQVTLAREPDERTERQLAVELSLVLGKKVIPHVRVDRAILGGIIVRYGDRVLDGSLRRRLLSMRHRLLEVALPAKVTT
jgi:F-type H+-transporting ATPase subunit delta